MIAPSPPPPPPQAPPPPPLPLKRQHNQASTPSDQVPTTHLPPLASGEQPGRNAILVSLLVYNGHPFADHWEYFVAAPGADGLDVGVVIQAAGDVRAGFWLEVKRGWRVPAPVRGGSSSSAGAGVGVPKRITLAWVGDGYFRPDGVADARDEEGRGMRWVFEGGEDGEAVVERAPRCEFERVLFKVPAPEKTLRAVDGEGDGRTRITQRNCQTWVVESAEQLVREGIFEQRVVDYLRATSIMTV